MNACLYTVTCSLVLGTTETISLCNMSSNAASTDPMEAHTDIQGEAILPQLPAFEETDLEVTDHVCVTIQHGEDNSKSLSMALLKYQMLQQLVP